jgi:hypothetical protein
MCFTDHRVGMWQIQLHRPRRVVCHLLQVCDGVEGKLQYSKAQVSQ